jgi:hypothetical protein
MSITSGTENGRSATSFGTIAAASASRPATPNNTVNDDKGLLSTARTAPRGQETRRA